MQFSSVSVCLCFTDSKINRTSGKETSQFSGFIIPFLLSLTVNLQIHTFFNARVLETLTAEPF